MDDEWESGFMQDWQSDLDTVEEFCESELENQKQRLAHARRIPKEGEKRKVAEDVAQTLDSMLALPEKWKDFPSFYFDFRDYISQMSEAREIAGKSMGNIGQSKPSLIIQPSKPQKPILSEHPFANLLAYYQSRGVIGEGSLCILQALCAANRISFGVEGASGSGKTFVLDALLGLLPDEAVYRVGLSSDNAIFNDTEKLNNAEFVYIPELQKAMGKKTGSTVEAIKDLTEGKDAVRVVTAKKGKCSESRIRKGKAIIYTLAAENRFRKDVETRRRFVVLHTDITAQHVGDVLAKKAESRCSYAEEQFSEGDFDALKSHLWECCIAEYLFKDPFSVYMARHIPNIPKSVGFVDHYYALLDACAKFNYPKRAEFAGQMFLSLEDHYLVHALYHNDFCANLSSICANGEANVVDSAKGNVDWQQCWDAGVNVMKLNFPHIYDKWIELQSRDGSVSSYNPIKNEKVILAK